MLDIKNCSIVIVDVQGKLAQLMHARDALFKNIQILIKAAKTLHIPILWCQQAPEALGPTVPEIARLLSDIQPINKTCFSCCAEEQFNSRLTSIKRNQLLLCGIEAHVCIYQTAVELQKKGYQVSVISDAVSSRTFENKQIALNNMVLKGITISSTEMALFELLKTADHPQFRQVAKLIK